MGKHYNLLSQRICHILAAGWCLVFTHVLLVIHWLCIVIIFIMVQDTVSMKQLALQHFQIHHDSNSNYCSNNNSTVSFYRQIYLIWTYCLVQKESLTKVALQMCTLVHLWPALAKRRTSLAWQLSGFTCTVRSTQVLIDTVMQDALVHSKDNK